MDFVALDFETANRSPASACALGLVTVVGGRLVDEASWLIQPQPLAFDPAHTQLHGIDAQRVRQAPRWEELWPEIKPYLDGQVWVAHNASFDMRVLAAQLVQAGLEPPRGGYLCSWRLARWALPGLDSYSLGCLAQHFDWEHRHHDALSDARLCALLTLRCLATLSVGTPQDLPPPLQPQPFHLGLAPHPLPSPLAEVPWGQGEGLAGKTVAFTGQLDALDRPEAVACALKAGARVLTDIVENLDYLVVGAAGLPAPLLTRKLQAALRLHQDGRGPVFLDEETFLTMLEWAGVRIPAQEEDAP